MKKAPMRFLFALLAAASIAFLPAAEDDLIIDNDDPAVERSGRWHKANLAAGFYGADYLTAVVGSEGPDSVVTYRATVEHTGSYEIALWYPATPTRSTAVAVRVDTETSFGDSSAIDDDGDPIAAETPYPADLYPEGMMVPPSASTPVTILDQRQNGGSWVVLGEWRLIAGRTVAVSISTNGQRGITVADAVRFRLTHAAEVAVPFSLSGSFVDDGKTLPSRVDFNGTWYGSAHLPHSGDGYHVARPDAPPGTQAVYTPEIPRDGVYEVVLYFPAFAGRSSATPVTVRHRHGTSTMLVDQRTSGAQAIGRWAFSAGEDASVTIDASQADGYVIADAVAFRLAAVPAKQALPVPGRFPGSAFNLDAISGDEDGYSWSVTVIPGTEIAVADG